jgi:hypothetical protein
MRFNNDRALLGQLFGGLLCASVSSIASAQPSAPPPAAPPPSAPAPAAAPPPATTPPGDVAAPAAATPAPAPTPTADAPAAADVPAAPPPSTPEPLAAETTEEVAPEPDSEKKSKKDKKGKDAGLGRFEIHGRVFARAAYAHEARVTVQPDGSIEEGKGAIDLSVPTARIGFDYDAPVRGVTAQLEIELTGRPDLRDAWVRYRNDDIMLKAGQSKMPFSVIEMDSILTLPLAERGLISDLMEDGLQIAGRRPGFVFALRGKEVLPEITVGAFQGSELVQIDTERELDLIERADTDAQSFVARVDVDVWDVTIGANYEHRVGAPAVLQRDYYWTAGIDAKLDTLFDDGGLRIWLEGIAGASFFEHSDKLEDGDDATFVVARGIAAYRFGGVEERKFYVEPYAMVAVLEPDADVVDDMVWEEAFGVNVGFWKVVRVGLEGQVRRAQRNFPEGYLLGVDPDSTTGLVQVGLGF